MGKSLEEEIRRREKHLSEATAKEQKSNDEKLQFKAELEKLSKERNSHASEIHDQNLQLKSMQLDMGMQEKKYLHQIKSLEDIQENLNLKQSQLEKTIEEFKEREITLREEIQASHCSNADQGVKINRIQLNVTNLENKLSEEKRRHQELIKTSEAEHLKFKEKEFEAKCNYEDLQRKLKNVENLLESTKKDLSSKNEERIQKKRELTEHKDELTKLKALFTQEKTNKECTIRDLEERLQKITDENT